LGRFRFWRFSPCTAIVQQRALHYSLLRNKNSRLYT